MGRPPHEPEGRAPITWVAYGPDALLFTFADRPGIAAAARCRALCSWLEEHPPRGLIEVVPAFTTLMLRFHRRVSPPAESLAPSLAEGFQSVSAEEESRLPAPIEIPIIYRGEDLDDVARHTGIKVDEVVARHCAPIYRVALLGFTPGFPYLLGLDPALHVPRRASPRQRIAPGSVAIGGGHTGIYTVESPGGWNLIGSTSLRLFDPSARGIDGMFRLRAGDRVRFLPVRP